MSSLPFSVFCTSVLYLLIYFLNSLFPSCSVDMFLFFCYSFFSLCLSPSSVAMKLYFLFQLLQRLCATRHFSLMSFILIVVQVSSFWCHLKVNHKMHQILSVITRTVACLSIVRRQLSCRERGRCLFLWRITLGVGVSSSDIRTAAEAHVTESGCCVWAVKRRNSFNGRVSSCIL